MHWHVTLKQCMCGIFISIHSWNFCVLTVLSLVPSNPWLEWSTVKWNGLNEILKFCSLLTLPWKFFYLGLLLCLSVISITKKMWMHFHDIFVRGMPWDKKHPIKFWYGSRTIFTYWYIYNMRMWNNTVMLMILVMSHWLKIVIIFVGILHVSMKMIFIASWCMSFSCVECRVTEGSRCRKTAGKHIKDERSSLQGTWSSVCSTGNIMSEKHLLSCIMLFKIWLFLFVLFSSMASLFGHVTHDSTRVIS